MDPELLEKAEASIDAFIERRAKEKQEASAIEAAWAESTRRHNEERQRELREEWRRFHKHMQGVHQGLAGEHAEKAEALLEEGGTCNA